ncbi:uncharacterized protein LOC105190970 isoform X2 [Harpegnathos saltator]|nr:uncharacterized protein LOC105190970 isoform X2 [Harpegnathos saltator]
MDFFQMAKNSNVTINAETIEYLGETQSTRAQYDVYEYGQESTSEDAEKYTPDQFLISSRGSTLADTENPEEEPYDYETLKLEYEQQLEYGMKHGKVLNYTEKKEPKDTPREALKRIMGMKQAKNCTKEEISQIGIKAIECLAYDYQHARDMATAGKILSRTWLVLRVWLLIYICLAIPCWCQRGWCCWCFRCKFCLPRKRILFAKQYYTMNPPGTLVRNFKKEKDVQEPIKYEATEEEHNAYRTFEAAIKNI